MTERFSAYKSTEGKKIEHIIHASLALAGGALWKAKEGDFTAFVLIMSIAASAIGYCYWYFADWVAFVLSELPEETRAPWLANGKRFQAICFAAVACSFAGSIIALLIMFFAGNVRIGYGTRDWMLLAGVLVVVVLAGLVLWDFKRLQRRSYT